MGKGKELREPEVVHHIVILSKHQSPDINTDVNQNEFVIEIPPQCHH